MIDPTPGRVSLESNPPNQMMGGGLNLSVFSYWRYERKMSLSVLEVQQRNEIIMYLCQ